MKQPKNIWMYGLLATVLIISLPVIIFYPREGESRDDPWASMPVREPHTSHVSLIQGPFETPQEVTQVCLECHEASAHEVMDTAHWNWLGDPVYDPSRGEEIQIGKANLLNNFCIGVQSNWQACTACHAGYGWVDADYDFSIEENVDCLVCHDTTGTYLKGGGGYPVEGVDLVDVAQNVGYSSRQTCGTCHFRGGGGNAIKHGDLDSSLIFPSEDIDVHMGRYDFVCTDCHQTEDHDISGRSISVSIDNANQVYCTDCHNQELHEDERINTHTQTVACQTCHIPAFALEYETKMEWDWSTAGDDGIVEDPHVYLMIKGSFVYQGNVIPEYYWYNGFSERYLLGDPMDPDAVTPLNFPLGDINDPSALIMPFKVHRGSQIYDAIFEYFLQPRTVGAGGYWTEFDWDLALRLGAEVTGIPYSGEYDFAETEMYWPITHMVQPSEDALQCVDCHSENGRLDWEALGYPGDPMEWGGREIEE